MLPLLLPLIICASNVGDKLPFSLPEQIVRIPSESTEGLTDTPVQNTPNSLGSHDTWLSIEPLHAAILKDDGDAAYAQGYRLRWYAHNFNDAFKFYEQAAGKGHRQAMHEAAAMAFSGIGVSKNLDKAFQWYSLLVSQYKDPSAANALGLMYLNEQLPEAETAKYVGRKQERIAKAIELFRLSEKGGDGLALKNLEAAQAFMKGN